MGNKVYFLIDGASENREKILSKEKHPETLYMGLELERRGEATVVDSGIWNILKMKAFSTVVTNRGLYIPLLKLLGHRVILININVRKDFKIKTRSLKEKLLNIFYFITYSLCNSPNFYLQEL